MDNFILLKNLDNNFILDKLNKKIKVRGLVSSLKIDDNVLTLITTEDEKFKVDLSALSNDKFINDVSLDDGILSITLKDKLTSDNKVYKVDLNKVATLKTTDTPTLQITGNGKDQPLAANVLINTEADNILTATPTGLKVSLNLYDAFGTKINL